MLRSVASGPFPAATEMGAGGAILGLVVHFTLMAIMAAVFMLAGRRAPACSTSPLERRRLRPRHLCRDELDRRAAAFRAPLPPKPMSIATQLFAHIVLVGIPFALIAARATCAALTNSCERVALALYCGHDRLRLQSHHRK